MDFCYFRAGIGTIIYRRDGTVAWFERAAHPKGVWQFQQGGIDPGETPGEALWRELYEETGVTRDDIQRIDEYPYWLSYAYEHEMRTDELNRIGQTHRWYFLKLKDGYRINLSKAPHGEFSKMRWITFEEAQSETNTLKSQVYKQLGEYFKRVVI